MQSNYYVYANQECNIQIDKMPVWFKEKETTGNKDSGIITLHSTNDYDEVWGANAKMEISWESKKRTESFHAKEVQNSIDMYNSIEIVVTQKEHVWVRSHECTIWYGTRTKMIRKHFYRERVIHAVIYCDMTERQFNIHTGIIADHYTGFKPFIIEAYNAVICH